MDYVLEQSLESMALTKIAVVLWNQDDADAKVTRYVHILRSLPYGRRGKIMWIKEEDKVIEKVSGLLLPKPLKKKVLKFISVIGWEILKWREYLSHRFDPDIVLKGELCWTQHGMVDTKKTAEAFIQNEDVGITVRYRLACDYCLEDDIPKLWDKIPENCREWFCNSIDRKQENFLVVLWTHHIKGEMDKLDDEIKSLGILERSPRQYAFECAAICGNKVGTEYFWQRLTHEERKVSLVTSAKEVAHKASVNDPHYPLYFPNILCFLFCQMDEQEQREILKIYPGTVLKCLLEWPLQGIFMEMANRTWDFLPENDFYAVLREIITKVKEGHKDCDYPKLFEELWQKSRDVHKKYVTHACIFPFLSLALFGMEDKKPARLILNSATVEWKEEIIFCSSGKLICKRLVAADEWDSVKLFLQECLSSKKVMIKFKEVFEKRLERRTSPDYEREKSVRRIRERIVCKLPEKYAARKHKWDKFFRLLDDLIQENNNKRSAEEAGENTSAKRLCGTEFEDVAHKLGKKMN